MKSLTHILQRAMTDRLQPWALATLVRTSGSTYRKPGARLLVDPRGDTLGVLSGGCLEEEIGRRGKGVIQSGVPEVVTFDTRRIYGCNGYLEILIERFPQRRELEIFSRGWVKNCFVARSAACARTLKAKFVARICCHMTPSLSSNPGY
jgi:xanthine/CO dehydrogenase XdhC/CoxF family maturation factor